MDSGGNLTPVLLGDRH